MPLSPAKSRHEGNWLHFSYVFGGHEIDVDVNSKGEMVCAEMR